MNDKIIEALANSRLQNSERIIVAWFIATGTWYNASEVATALGMGKNVGDALRKLTKADYLMRRTNGVFVEFAAKP
jgi:hypothetical protein